MSRRPKDLIPEERRATIVDAMEELANILNPNNDAFQKLLQGCRCGIPTGITDRTKDNERNNGRK